MKLNELKYITQDIIDKGGINVTSPEMLDEARRYNMDAVSNAAKRRRLSTVTGIFIIFQIPVLLFSFAGALFSSTLHDMFTTDLSTITSYAILAAMFIGLFAYLGMFSYYIIFKGLRDPKMMFLCSLPAAATTLTGIVIVILNTVLGLIYTKTEERLSEEAGYPAFVRLNVTTIESDSNSIIGMTYDSIKERAKQRRSDDDQFL